jgi:hypothetical protein
MVISIVRSMEVDKGGIPTKLLRPTTQEVESPWTTKEEKDRWIGDVEGSIGRQVLIG